MCIGVSVPGSTRVPGSGAPPVRPVRSARAEFAARGRTGANPVTGSLNPSDNPRQFQPPPPPTAPPPSSGMTVPTAPPPAVPKPLPTQDTSFLGQGGEDRARRRRRARTPSAAPSLLSGVLVSSANTDNSLLG